MNLLDLIKSGIDLDKVKGIVPKEPPVDVVTLEVKYPFKSLNFAHAASGKSHWKERKGVIDKAESLIASKIMQHRGLMLEMYRFDIRYNSKIDPVNVSYAAKMFEDCCGYLKIITKDDKRYNKGFSITPDESLPHNTYIFVLRRII